MKRIEKEEFVVVDLKMVQLTIDQARELLLMNLLSADGENWNRYLVTDCLSLPKKCMQMCKKRPSRSTLTILFYFMAVSRKISDISRVV